ncbi:Uncharacterized protein FKW44_000053, partial [Caligus rogercresseyi]
DGSIMPSHFVEASLKINTVEYVHILEEVVFSLGWMRGLVWTMWYSSRTLHHAMVQDHTDLVGQKNSQFREGLNWPCNNLNLNLLDYFLWGVLQERVNEHSHGSVDQFKASIIKNCKKIPVSDVVAAAQKFRASIKAVIEAKGGHIE